VNNENFTFKLSTLILNILLFIGGVWLINVLWQDVVDSVVNFNELSDFYFIVFVACLIWIVLCEFGYQIMLFFPRGRALELNSDSLKVCTVFGMKTIPKKAVRGCKNPVHRATGGLKAGLVIISVDPEYRVMGPYGFKINPQFSGSSVAGENEVSLVKKIRAWRKQSNC